MRASQLDWQRPQECFDLDHALKYWSVSDCIKERRSDFAHIVYNVWFLLTPFIKQSVYRLMNPPAASLWRQPLQRLGAMQVYDFLARTAEPSQVESVRNMLERHMRRYSSLEKQLDLLLAKVEALELPASEMEFFCGFAITHWPVDEYEHHFLQGQRERDHKKLVCKYISQCRHLYSLETLLELIE
jgi:hypothetical protein